MNSPNALSCGKSTLSFSKALPLLAMAPLWLMLDEANTTAQAQTSADVSSATTSAAPSPGDWTQFLRDNMERWNPYNALFFCAPRPH